MVLKRKWPISCRKHGCHFYGAVEEAILHVIDTGHELRIPAGYCELESHDFENPLPSVTKAFACVYCGAPNPEAIRA